MKEEEKKKKKKKKGGEPFEVKSFVLNNEKALKNINYQQNLKIKIFFLEQRNLNNEKSAIMTSKKYDTFYITT